jgi:hypothetical protein
MPLVLCFYYVYITLFCACCRVMVAHNRAHSFNDERARAGTCKTSALQDRFVDGQIYWEIFSTTQQ